MELKEIVVDFGFLALDQNATLPGDVLQQYFDTMITLSFHFIIRSAATSDPLLTGLLFSQLLHQSKNPGISCKRDILSKIFYKSLSKIEIVADIKSNPTNHSDL